MVLWNSVQEYILPLRFQIPRGYCEYGKSNQYNLLSVQINDETFLEWFRELELKLVGKDLPLESRIKGECINVKYVEDFTQIFDEENKFRYAENETFADCNLDCLVEIDKVYGPMKDTGVYGVTCKLFQVRVHKNNTCLFSD
jgi:hypothetical protein